MPSRVSRRSAGTSSTPVTAVDRAALGRLSEQHWRLLLLIGQHGCLSTPQIATLLFDSRPTAVRHLAALHDAGLVQRAVHPVDRRHRAAYTLSSAGEQILFLRLRESGQPAPAVFGHRGLPGLDHEQTRINEFFVSLVAHGRRTGRGHLYQWGHSDETEGWLHRNGVPGVRAEGDGLWIEGNVAVRFVLHIDHDLPSVVDDTPAPPPSARLRGYRRARAGVPADAALVVTTSDAREEQLHNEVAQAPVPLVVAVTTRPRLRAAGSPADPIWTIGTRPGELLPLAGVTTRDTAAGGS